MRKLVLKTALISFAAAIAAVALGAVVFALAFPSRASDVAFDLKFGRLSVDLAERAYQKADADSEEGQKLLAALVEKAIIAKQHTVVVLYAGKYMETDYFAARRNKPLYDDDNYLYYGYINGNLAVAYYMIASEKEGGEKKNFLDDALETLMEVPEIDRYAKGCSARYLLHAFADAKDEEFAKRFIEEFDGSDFDEAELALYREDKARLAEIFGWTEGN